MQNINYQTWLLISLRAAFCIYLAFLESGPCPRVSISTFMTCNSPRMLQAVISGYSSTRSLGNTNYQPHLCGTWVAWEDQNDPCCEHRAGCLCWPWVCLFFFQIGPLRELSFSGLSALCTVNNHSSWACSQIQIRFVNIICAYRVWALEQSRKRIWIMGWEEISGWQFFALLIGSPNQGLVKLLDHSK